MSDIKIVSSASAGKNGDFPDTVVFDLEKLAVTLSKLPVCMCIYISRGRNRQAAPDYVREIRHGRQAICPFSASWRIRVADPAFTPFDHKML